jgi:hypothetical protein
MEIDKDAFSTSQVLSKIWLAEKLEEVVKYNDITNPLRILCLGGWYGLTNFILRSRNNLLIESFRSVDIDEAACTNADLINKAWEWQSWQFKSIVADANTFHYTLDEFDVVINTSSEHMGSTQWFDNIPDGMLTIIQSNNMPHDDHCHNHTSVEDLSKEFPLKTMLFEGTRHFSYPDWSFDRYMIIGEK